MRKSRKGQSTLEYVIILAAVVGAIIAVGAMLKPKINNSYSELYNKVDTKMNSISF